MPDLSSTRKLLSPGSSLRIFFYGALSALLSWSLYAQARDTTIHFSLSSDTRYLDLFRQKTSYSNTVMAARENQQQLRFFRGDDTIDVSYLHREQWAETQHNITVLSASLKERVELISLSWKSRWSAFFYEASLVADLQHHRQSYYSGSLSYAPFGKNLIVECAGSVLPFTYSGHVIFQDFHLLIDQVAKQNTFRGNVRGTLFADLDIGAGFEKKRISADRDKDVSSAELLYESSTTDAFLRYCLEPGTNLWLEGSISDLSISRLVFYTRGESFGNLSYGTLEVYHGACGAEKHFGQVFIRLMYHYDRWSTEEVGHIESWPFTTVAASVILNRFYYRSNSSVNIHTATVQGSMPFIGLQCSFGMDYLLITPDISIEHWEPQFLVFGSKNFGADFVTIERAHILQLKARIAVPFDIVTLRVDGSQYLPLSISYRPGRPGVVPAPPALPGPPPKTDGGRAFGLTVLIHM